MVQLARVGRLFSWAMPKAMRAALTKIPSRLKPLDSVGGKNAIYPVKQNQLSGLHYQQVARSVRPEINASTIRVLNRLGVDSKRRGALLWSTGTSHWPK